MSLTCTCPNPTKIADITAITCFENFGQIQMITFWRAGTSIADVATMILAATWTALFAATGSTHTIFTPIIHNPTVEPGAVITVGSGNEVPDGSPIVNGSDPTKWSFICRRWPAESIRNLKDLMCETSLEVILVNRDGYFGHRVDGTTVKGFPIHALFVGDKKIGGYSDFDQHVLSFETKENWSDYFTITDPTANFNPLEDW
jgi:hypothetical protein